MISWRIGAFLLIVCNFNDLDIRVHLSADWRSGGLSMFNLKLGRLSLCHHPDTMCTPSPFLLVLPLSADFFVHGISATWGHSASRTRCPNADAAAPLGLCGQNPVTQYIFWCSRGLSTPNLRFGRSSLCHHPDATDAVFTPSSSLTRPPFRPWVSAAWSQCVPTKTSKS